MWDSAKKGFRTARLMVFGLCCLQVACAAPPETKQTELVGINQLILDEIKSMPRGGGYLASKRADKIRQDAFSYADGRIAIDEEAIKPSYCSGATYLVFVNVLQRLQNGGEIALAEQTLRNLAVADAKDGVGIWGRWNANGPGTAKLFADTGCGKNFKSLNAARPGDFLKIFWTEEVGRKERGHSVIYLSHNDDSVTFWSSNEKIGYGMKSVPLVACKHLLISRLTAPQKLDKFQGLPERDAYLADMLNKEHTRSAMQKRLGL